MGFGIVTVPQTENAPGERTLRSTLVLLSQSAILFHYIIASVCERLEKVGLMTPKKFTKDLKLTGERAKARLAELSREGISEVDISNLELEDWKGLAISINKLTETTINGKPGTRIGGLQLEVILKAFVELMVKLGTRFDKVEGLMTTYEKERLRVELEKLDDFK